ncbi:MAG: threonine synthase [Bauldia sp.]|nr:threonine synthase [Bauldia sp.]
MSFIANQKAFLRPEPILAGGFPFRTACPAARRQDTLEETWKSAPRLDLRRHRYVDYVSTRGSAPALGFADVLLAGLADDGGLYVPRTWPTLSREVFAGFAGRPYAEVAQAVIAPFVGDEIPAADLRRMCVDAYAGFRHRATAPLRETGPGEWVLELFHGPTLAFKDFAMQLLARLMDHVLARRNERITLIAATSGDTGGAAVEAFAGRNNIDLFVLFPEGRVSPFQQRQMTTTGAANVHALAVEGTFDDCQAMVKAAFGNREIRRRLAITGVNSINWARIVAQIVYYVSAAVALGAPKVPVAFSVPTGNFGDVFAGYAAKRMGLPVGRLIVATNVNDILARTLATGRYEIRDVHATTSPSMDIQISSNFERLLFEAYGRDAAAVRALMEDLRTNRAFTIATAPLAAIRDDFAAGMADEAEVAATIAETYRDTGFLPDPHTAVGIAVGQRFRQEDLPLVTLSTAHPAKFAAAVEAATGRPPQFPDGFDDLADRKQTFTVIANDQRRFETYLTEHARAVKNEA